MSRQYRIGERNDCPGCGRSQWLVGRITAECAFCHSAIPLAEHQASAPRAMIKRGKGGGKTSRMALPAWAA